jgi:dihydrofolate reductase
VTVTIVAAVARNGVIGRDGAVPWRLPEDMRRFRATTTGHAVVMGRKTWDSLPDRFRPLPGRRNLVLTRDPEWAGEGAESAGSLEEALSLVRDAQEVFVIGGAEIYESALPHADELQLTEVDADYEGDTFFPAWDPAEFAEAGRERHVSETGLPFTFVRYVRRAREP